MKETFDEIDRHISTIDDLLSRKVIGDGFEERIAEAADYLEGAMKNKEFTSRGVFHERVSLMDKSAILAIDIGDLGVDVLRTYEEDLFAVDAKMVSMQDVYAGIGDRETYAMNSIRGRLVKLYDEVFNRGEGEKIIGLVEGGDEIIFAFDLSQEGQSEKIDEFRRRLQSEVGVPMRVVLTSHEVKKKGAMQAISTKESVDSGAQTGMIDPRLEAHILSMDRSERGADASKTCEASLRKLYKMIEHIPSSSTISEGQIRELVVTQGLDIQEWEVADTLFLSDRDDFEDVKPLTFKVTHLDKSVTEMTPDELQGKIEGMYTQVKELEQMMNVVANFSWDLQALRMGAVERRRQYSAPEEDAYEKKVFAALNGIDKQKWVATLDGIKDGKFVVSIGQGDKDAWNRKETDTTISLSGVSPREVTEYLQDLMDDIRDKISN